MVKPYDFEETLTQFRGLRDEAEAAHRVRCLMRDARRFPEEIQSFEVCAAADIIATLVTSGTYLVHCTRGVQWTDGVESATWFRVGEDNWGHEYDVVAHATSREGRLHMLACLLASAVVQMEASLCTGPLPHMAA